MITELERRILLELTKGERGITEITRKLTNGVTKKDYEKMKYHLKALVEENIITRNGRMYKINTGIRTGTATITLTTDDDNTLILEAGKTIFVTGEEIVNDETRPATAVIFLEEKKSNKNIS
jgi:acyl CoA:acetate/3-ketoacid CoA transferase alpha subunit